MQILNGLLKLISYQGHLRHFDLEWELQNVQSQAKNIRCYFVIPVQLKGFATNLLNHHLHMTIYVNKPRLQLRLKENKNVLLNL